MSANNPDLEEKTWEGSVELDLGDLGYWDAELQMKYSSDGNCFHKGEHKLWAWFTDAKGEAVKVDLTESISQSVLDVLMEEYIVNG